MTSLTETDSLYRLCVQTHAGPYTIIGTKPAMEKVYDEWLRGYNIDSSPIEIVGYADNADRKPMRVATVRESIIGMSLAAATAV